MTGTARRLSSLLVPSVVSGLLASSCGGSSGHHTTPTATPTPVETFSVVVTLWLDDDRDGARGINEGGVVPDAEVDIGGGVGTSEPGTGGVIVTGVPRGTFPVTFRRLPPYYRGEATINVEVPQAPGAAALLVPMDLPTENTVAGLYLASGDSISQGQGSSDDMGYRPRLEAKLRQNFGRGDIQYRGGGTGETGDGAGRIDRDLRLVRPSFTLIQWGVNDYNDLGCQVDPAAPTCNSISNLRQIVESVKAARSLPCLATITPPNAASPFVGEDRVTWAANLSEMIRALAREQGVLLVDLHEAFRTHPNLPSLFTDHVHPNDDGYELIASTYIEALVRGTLSTSGAQDPVLLPLTAPEASRP